MITSINSLSIKKHIKSPNKSINNLYSKFILESNNKYITQNKSNLKLIDNINIEKSLNSLRYLNKNNSSFNSNNNPINENNYSYDNNDNIENIKNNIKNIKKKIALNNSNSNTNTILNPRFITLVNDIQQNRNNIIKSPKSISTKLPKITRKILLTEADMLIKERQRHDGLLEPHVATNIKLKKSAQINMKNYVIRKIKEKREEIQNDEKKITEEFKNKKEIYDKRYRNFLDSIEQDLKKQKEEEDELNLLKLSIENQENILNKEKINNKKLVDKLKAMINSIVSFTKYGSFIHKIFGRNFIYEELKDFDGKEYYKTMFRFIDIYDKYENDMNYIKEENDFLEMLLFQGVDFLNMQFLDMEANLRKQLDNKNYINEEIEVLKIKKNNEINILINNKIENEKNKIIFNNEKNKQMEIIKSLDEYDIEDTKTYLKYIMEFWEILLGNKNKKTKKSKNMEIMEEQLFYCDETLKELEKKEIIINKYINEIDNIFKYGKKDDKDLIEKIINDKKKYNIKKKQIEINKIQEEIQLKKKFQTIDEQQRIIIKGRKVIQDFPLIKNNKKKKKIIIKKNIDDFEYLYYSSD